MLSEPKDVHSCESLSEEEVKELQKKYKIPTGKSKTQTCAAIVAAAKHRGRGKFLSSSLQGYTSRKSGGAAPAGENPEDIEEIKTTTGEKPEESTEEREEEAYIERETKIAKLASELTPADEPQKIGECLSLDKAKLNRIAGRYSVKNPESQDAEDLCNAIFLGRRSRALMAIKYGFEPGIKPTQAPEGERMGEREPQGEVEEVEEAHSLKRVSLGSLARELGVDTNAKSRAHLAARIVAGLMRSLVPGGVTTARVGTQSSPKSPKSTRIGGADDPGQKCMHMPIAKVLKLAARIGITTEGRSQAQICADVLVALSKRKGGFDTSKCTKTPTEVIRKVAGRLGIAMAGKSISEICDEIALALMKKAKEKASVRTGAGVEGCEELSDSELEELAGKEGLRRKPNETKDSICHRIDIAQSRECRYRSPRALETMAESYGVKKKSGESKAHLCKRIEKVKKDESATGVTRSPRSPKTLTPKTSPKSPGKVSRKGEAPKGVRTPPNGVRKGGGGPYPATAIDCITTSSPTLRSLLEDLNIYPDNCNLKSEYCQAIMKALKEGRAQKPGERMTCGKYLGKPKSPTGITRTERKSSRSGGYPPSGFQPRKIFPTGKYDCSESNLDTYRIKYELDKMKVKRTGYETDKELCQMYFREKEKRKAGGAPSPRSGGDYLVSKEVVEEFMSLNEAQLTQVAAMFGVTPGEYKQMAPMIAHQVAQVYSSQPPPTAKVEGNQPLVDTLYFDGVSKDSETAMEVVAGMDRKAKSLKDFELIPLDVPTRSVISGHFQ